MFAGAGPLAKDLVPKTMSRAEVVTERFRYYGDPFMHELEKIVGSTAIGRIRAEHHVECHCW